MTTTNNMANHFDTIEITPIDNEVRLMAESVNIVNEFKKRGFSRSAFVNIVTSELAKYLTIAGMNKLSAYWYGRVRDEALNNDLQQLLETLNHE